MNRFTFFSEAFLFAVRKILFAVSSLVLVGCSVDLDPAKVRCTLDMHCPALWHCSNETDGADGICVEGVIVGDDDSAIADDDDSVGDDDDSANDVDNDEDGVTENQGDCDDNDPERFPGQFELCDGEDNDCSGLPSAPGEGVNEDLDGSPACADCDDEDPDRFVGNAESCDAIDSDCDGDLVDEDLDTDGDDEPDCTDEDDDGDFAPDSADCSVLDSTVFPGATELCDAIDSDCDLDLLEGFPDLDLDLDPDCTDLDADGDGSLAIDDCDDLDPARFSGNVESCDAIDQDCDDDLLESFDDLDLDLDPDCTDPDADGDGSLGVDDCDDLDGTRFPGNVENCDGIDSDCDGSLLDTSGDTDLDGTPDCLDLDDDGDLDPDTSDCAALDPSIFTNAPEACDNVDGDCDLSLIDGFANLDGDGEPDCVDGDADGDGTIAVEDCDDLDAGSTIGADDADCDGTVTIEDCDDADPLRYTNAPESCDAIDSDCDLDLVDSDSNSDSDSLPDCIDPDADGDGTDAAFDCDDLDPLSTLLIEDNDCDSILTADDCDDLDPLSTTVVEDPDCDGVIDDILVIDTQQGIDFVLVPAGTFTMGCVAGRDDVATGCLSDESPYHTVTLTHGVWMTQVEVTQGQWLSWMGYAPSSFPSCGSSCPVETVNWHEAAAFGNALSGSASLTPCYTCTGSGTGVACSPIPGSPYLCSGYRLPTEAEWEYAARGGDEFPFAGSNDVGVVAWYSSNSSSAPHGTALRAPNGRGLHDLSGNVQEWTGDFRDNPPTYPFVAQVDPYSTAGAYSPVRGGSWSLDAQSARVAARGGNYVPGARDWGIGFRLVRSIPYDDSDGDGDPDLFDCADADPARYTNAPELCDNTDSDCDGSLVDTFSNSDSDSLPDCIDPDADGDGADLLDDCDDLDPLSTLIIDDADCDTTLTADDCDDNDPLSTTLAEDADCDGVIDDAPIIETQQGIDFAYIPSGTFTMGCLAPRDQVSYGCHPNESPPHTVTLLRSMWMMTTEVTQDQFAARMAYNPSGFGSCGGTCPVETVSWSESAAFANSMSQSAGLTSCYTCTGSTTSTTCSEISGSPYVCTGYRLPTEAEWEYAARGAEDFAYAGTSVVGDAGWYRENSGIITNPTALKVPNGYGLFDMTGNVQEWSGDLGDGSSNYPSSAVIDPYGSSGADRMLRSGQYNFDARDSRTAFRASIFNFYRTPWVGFRLVRAIPLPDSDLDGDPDLFDCDDSDSSRYSNAPESCDAIDSDCDGSLVDTFSNVDSDSLPDCIDDDADGDGVEVVDDCDDLDALSTILAEDADCDAILTAEDCDDNDPAAYPTAFDPDCDGVVLRTEQGIEFAFVPAGSYTMGCLTGRDDVAGGCDADESPSHSVTLTHSMWFSETEVSQAQWFDRMGYAPSTFASCGTDCPVENVNWHESAAFANAMSSATGLPLCYACSGSGSSVTCAAVSGSPYDCTGFRLPTEGEWEYAARGGEALPYAGSGNIADVAWHDTNSSAMTHPVATLNPNAFGLHDLTGNVGEWTADLYGSAYYTSAAITDPVGPTTGSFRARRGGSYNDNAGNSRVAERNFGSASNRSGQYGVRLMRSIPGDDADLDGDPGPTDCADADPTRYNNAPESCDSIDTDCDNSLVDSFSDLDLDGSPDCIDSDADGDGIDAFDDCDDLDALSTIVPDDNDCDGAATVDDCDDDDPLSWTVAQDPDCNGIFVDVQQGIDFVYVPPGNFTMGCVVGRDDLILGCQYKSNESPAHQVTLTHAMWVGEVEVTQAQWLSRMGYAPSAFSGCGPNCPVEMVTWYEAAAFANAMSVDAGLPSCYSCTGTGPSVTCAFASGTPYLCTGFRLPTEAEWEYAARGGEEYAYAGSADENAVGWNAVNSGSTTHQGAGKLPNAFGLYDMSGNVQEWIGETFISEYPTSSPVTDPWGTPPYAPCTRGGSFGTNGEYGRVGRRNFEYAQFEYDSLGFRVVRSIPSNDSDYDGDPDATDCADLDPTRYSAAPELCDDLDSDCDLSYVDGFADFDLDLNPDCNDLDADGDGNDAIDDCDDLDPSSALVIDDPDCDGFLTEQGIDFVLVPAGSFTMGCVTGRDDVAGGCFANESPSHPVTLTHTMWVMEAEVTQAEFTSKMGYSPSYFTGCPTCPVEQVNWHEGAAFANALSASAGLTSCYSCAGSAASVTCSPISGSPYVCTGYRLPTEAEWEYAGRGGEDFPFAGSSVVGDVAWYSSNSSIMTHPGAQKLPNGFGLYDLSGNVWEWSGDFWDGSANYPSAAQSDPYSASGAARVLRGGAWNAPAQHVRVAYRYAYSPYDRYYSGGFRVLRSVP